MGAFKLGKMTFGSLFKKPETTRYPFETKPQPEGLKGHIVVDADACILCGMCERSCTTNCIGVDKPGRAWSINRYQCIQCGYCITVCPKKCLAMDPNYAPAATAIARESVAIPEQEKPAKAKAAAKEPVKAKPAAQPAEAQSAATQAAAPTEPIKASAAQVKVDPQVERLVALMDPDKAKAVKDALARA